jgi:hypothetical protein
VVGYSQGARNLRHRDDQERQHHQGGGDAAGPHRAGRPRRQNAQHRDDPHGVVGPGDRGDQHGREPDQGHRRHLGPSLVGARGTPQPECGRSEHQQGPDLLGPAGSQEHSVERLVDGREGVAGPAGIEDQVQPVLLGWMGQQSCGEQGAPGSGPAGTRCGGPLPGRGEVENEKSRGELHRGGNPHQHPSPAGDPGAVHQAGTCQQEVDLTVVQRLADGDRPNEQRSGHPEKGGMAPASAPQGGPQEPPGQGGHEDQAERRPHPQGKVRRRQGEGHQRDGGEGGVGKGQGDAEVFGEVPGIRVAEMQRHAAGLPVDQEIPRNETRSEIQVEKRRGKHQEHRQHQRKLAARYRRGGQRGRSPAVLDPGHAPTLVVFRAHSRAVLLTFR